MRTRAIAVRLLTVAAVTVATAAGLGRPAAVQANTGTPAPMVDLALTGTAAAGTAAADHPAVAAIDGNAATTWCPAAAAGTLTVDLGRPRRLGGFDS